MTTPNFITHIPQEELAKLERAMLETYERELGLQLNQPERLKAVYGSHFFDADRKERLDSICKAVASLLETNVAAVNMITDQQQVQVACSTTDPVLSKPVEDSYCQHVVGTERYMSIEDSLRHALVCESKSTIEGGIRSYLGVPLISTSGHVIGSLCVWSYYPRTWSPSDVVMLASFAAVVMRFEAA